MNDILTDILRLPTEERARLAVELIRSLDPTPEAKASETWDTEWDDEIKRRVMEVENGTAETMSLDEYRAHVRKRRAARARR